MRTAFGAIPAVLVFGLSCSAAQPQDLGQRPDWSLKAGDKTVSAADYDKKVVIVNFWATWCPPCRQEIPGFIKLKNDYGGKGLDLVAFSQDYEEETHDKWIKEKGVNYVSIFASNDAGKAVLAKFESVIGAIEALPTTLVIDRKGRIIYKHLGYASYEELEKVIKPLL